ncbi:MAG: ABC transporter ATP-binding protein [Gemmatimonadaceae bacterium]
MSKDVAIRVDNLSKKYVLRGQQEKYRMVRDSIMNAVSWRSRAKRGAGGDHAAPTETEFMALDKVSFSVPRGEAIGIMGHNGAGKSTLLKILSRITEPTSGSATLHGRVGSLLEVGTGFHLELSGRENMYLNGAILGMKKAEIDEKFDQIVDFAEVGEFIDTPIKHYSTGMHLRLAFALAAHLQPEILLIDEVLAVGDAQFQRKCLGKMEDVAAGGRTVLFVSHNLSAVKELCTTGLVLSHGRLLFQGPVVEAISRYTQSTEEPNLTNPHEGWQQLRLVKPLAVGEWIVQPDDATTYSASLVLPADVTQGRVFMMIHNSTGELLVHQREDIQLPVSATPEHRRLHVSIALPPLWLAAGLYSVHFKFIGRRALEAEARYISERRILDTRGWSPERANALLAPTCKWSIEPVDGKLPVSDGDAVGADGKRDARAMNLMRPT